MTLNPAWDITYTVAALTPGATHRVDQVTQRLGGKGVNVASVLHQLGESVLATGLGRVESDLPTDFSPIAASLRRTVAVVDGRAATGFWEPGPAVSAAEWARFRRHFARLSRSAAVVVLAGSIPPAVPVDAYAQLIAIAHQRGAATVLDTSGPALAAGVAAGPTMVKPNAAELVDLPSAIPAGTTVVTSHGVDGLRAGGWVARPPWDIAGNPTGAGDAAVAGLARCLSVGELRGERLAAALRDAAALSAAAVATPVAGRIDPALYAELLPLIIVAEIG